MASTKSVPESYVDVLIIGAGPAGVMFGNALAHAGVKVRIVDKRQVDMLYFRDFMLTVNNIGLLVSRRVRRMPACRVQLRLCRQVHAPHLKM